MRRGRHSRSIPQAPPCGLCFLGKWLMSYDLKRNLGLRPTNRPSVIQSGRSFLFIAPEMRCLDVVRVIIPPRSSHPFRMSVIWHDVVVICELFVTDGAFPALLDNLAIQQLSHFCRRSEFPISPRMMRIINTSNPRP